MKITAVELTDMTDSKEELDMATSVENICYERVNVPSKLNVSLVFHSFKFPFLSNETRGYNLTPLTVLTLCALRNEMHPCL